MKTSILKTALHICVLLMSLILIIGCGKATKQSRRPDENSRYLVYFTCETTTGRVEGNTFRVFANPIRNERDIEALRQSIAVEITNSIRPVMIISLTKLE